LDAPSRNRIPTTGLDPYPIQAEEVATFMKREEVTTRIPLKLLPINFASSTEIVKRFFIFRFRFDQPIRELGSLPSSIICAGGKLLMMFLKSLNKQRQRLPKMTSGFRRIVVPASQGYIVSQCQSFSSPCSAGRSRSDIAQQRCKHVSVAGAPRW
jgi:hypothetical protein